mmetsp:Transcript_60158/g.143394  ORF Transcript_60158/g.143394 Transcript_60158/m.143394 type:complete len:242 (+) Transcript_60158:76-801(+)
MAVLAATISLMVLLATSLSGCYQEQKLPPVCKPVVPTSGPDHVRVYFGCGCFWHVQHEFAIFEMETFCRHNENITSRTSYAGGTKIGDDGLVCYHNMLDKDDYGELGHAEAVVMDVPTARFAEVAEKFWQICPHGNRRDPQDVGGEYRSVIGVPGGMQSHLMDAIREKADGTELVAGSGNEGDTLNTNKVWVYDTDSFPPHTAEKYHQFHNDMLDIYGTEYNNLRRFAQNTKCPGDGFLSG